MKKAGYKETIKKEKEMAILSAAIGAVEGYFAPTIQNIHNVLILFMIIATVKIIGIVARKKLKNNKMAHVFGNGFWPYITTFLAVWVILINL